MEAASSTWRVTGPVRCSCSPTACSRVRSAGDLMVTALSHLVRACVLDASRRARRRCDRSRRRRGGVVAHAPAVVDAATLRMRAAVAALGLEGGRQAAPRWREAVDHAASEGALGEMAIVLRTAGAVALHVGEPEIAATLFGAAPPSSAITVLPDLFPDELAALRARAQPAPGNPHLVEAVGRGRGASTPCLLRRRPNAEAAPASGCGSWRSRATRGGSCSTDGRRRYATPRGSATWRCCCGSPASRSTPSS